MQPETLAMQIYSAALTMSKLCRRINNRASARRVRQKREEDLTKITNMVRSSCNCSCIPVLSACLLRVLCCTHQLLLGEHPRSFSRSGHGRRL